MSDEELGWRWLPDVLEALLLPEDERKKLKRYKEPPPEMDWKTAYLVFLEDTWLYCGDAGAVVRHLELDDETEDALPALETWLKTAKHRDTFKIGEFIIAVFEAPADFLEVWEANMPEFDGW
jgi:hypothetical protein